MFLMKGRFNIRYFSRKTASLRSPAVKINNTFLALHYEKEIPYEYTRPLPDSPIEETNTILKTAMSPAIKEIFHKKNPEVARQELMDITHTTKHRWFPRARDKRAKKTESDRDYL